MYRSIYFCRMPDRAPFHLSLLGLFHITIVRHSIPHRGAASFATCSLQVLWRKQRRSDLFQPPAHSRTIGISTTFNSINICVFERIRNGDSRSFFPLIATSRRTLVSPAGGVACLNGVVFFHFIARKTVSISGRRWN